MPRPELKFYCVQLGKPIYTSKYGLMKKRNKRTKRIVYFAITNYKGSKCFRILSEDQYKKLKKK